MADTMTRKDVLARIKELVGEEEVEVHAFCDKMIASLSKPRPKRKNPAVAEFQEDVYEFVAALTDPVTNADVAAAFDVSTQKSAAALNALVKAGELYKDTDKKTAVYGVAELQY